MIHDRGGSYCPMLYLEANNAKNQRDNVLIVICISREIEGWVIYEYLISLLQ